MDVAAQLAHLLVNQKRRIVHEDSWQRVAFVVAFLRATCGHPLQYSCLPLLPILRLLANPLLDSARSCAEGEDPNHWVHLAPRQVHAELQARQLNADRFIDTLYCKAHIALTKPAAQCEAEQQPLEAQAAAAREASAAASPTAVPLSSERKLG